jgi:hypothetical protein
MGCVVMTFPDSTRLKKFVQSAGTCRRTVALCITWLISILLWLCVAWLYQATRLHFNVGTVEWLGRPTQEFVYPFHQTKSPKTKFILREKIDVSWLYPTIFSFYPQDALWTIRVNGHVIKAKSLPLSVTHHEGRSINLAPFLHQGTNEIELDMESFWGESSLNIYISPWDKYSVVIAFLTLIAAGTTGAFFCFLFRITIRGWEVAILAVGFLIRMFYFMGTPYPIRSYDWWGHVAYLDFVVEHLHLPDAHANWEAYQPPLYYLLVGGLTKLFFFCGMAEDQRYALWQAFSLVCSTGVLIVGLWIGRIIYEREIPNRLYLLAVLGVAPALAFNSSRISNDVLLNLLSFLWFGFLLQFWKKPDRRTWFGLSLILGLALLTKASALVLIPISVLCLILSPAFTIRSKAFLALSFAGVLLGIAGWYYLPRAFHETGVGNYVVGNLPILNPRAHIEGMLGKSLIFNPFKIVRYPFAEPWGPHHEYFLEVFFKTIFLGEWINGPSYRWMARGFMLAALLLIPVFLTGVYRSIKSRRMDSLPLLITLGAVFSAHWCFVQMAPFISSQDFRYSVILLVPMVYFFLQGASVLPAKWCQVSHFLLQLVILNCGIYLLELALEG